MIPKTAPVPNTPMTGRESARLPDVREVMLPIMYSYFPKMSRMKLPEIPGRIIAQMAMAPVRKINHKSSGVSVGESVQTTTPKITPNIVIVTDRSFQEFIPRSINRDDATIRPKKKAHVSIG